jgi:hypothetical protein
MMNVKLLKDVKYSVNWVFNGPAYYVGDIVPVVPANNLPDSKGKYWINTPELKDDPYGILLEPGDYEEV